MMLSNLKLSGIDFSGLPKVTATHVNTKNTVKDPSGSSVAKYWDSKHHYLIPDAFSGKDNRDWARELNETRHFLDVSYHAKNWRQATRDFKAYSNWIKHDGGLLERLHPEILRFYQSLLKEYKDKSSAHGIGIFDFISDMIKSVAYVVAAPVNSVTGHDFGIDYKTKAGSILGGSGTIGIDGIHVLGKSYADAITGGLATKVANKLRKDKNKEKAFDYNEAHNNHDYKVDELEKFHDGVTKVSGVVGALYGAKVAGGGIAGALSGGGSNVTDGLAKDTVDIKNNHVEASLFTSIPNWLKWVVGVFIAINVVLYFVKLIGKK